MSVECSLVKDYFVELASRLACQLAGRMEMLGIEPATAQLELDQG